MRNLRDLGHARERFAREHLANVRWNSAVQEVRSGPHRDSAWGGSQTYHLRPLMRTGGKSHQGPSRENSDASPGGSSRGTTTGTTLDIVLIDSSVLSRDSLDQMLTEQCQGMRTLSFETLDDAELYDRRPAVVVLVQAAHHGADDTFFASQITSARSRFPDTPVLAISDIDTPQACSKAFEAGAAGFFTMSGEAQQLLAAVQLLLAGGHYVPGSILAQLLEPGRPVADKPAARPASTAAIQKMEQRP